MGRKIKVPQGSEFVDATVVDINSSQENWNQYLLSDGTVLKFKSIATEVVKVDNQYDQEGNPIYMVKSTNVVSAIVPDELKKR
ncbi:MAG: hypothetical protein HY805_00460 [Nitrospirae bacterium]|nr:hypothetical protein [Nitrospirota bacterium]